MTTVSYAGASTTRGGRAGGFGAAAGSAVWAPWGWACVADAMSADVAHGGAAGPAFFFHLGDVVYYFGEGRYYYDQFYEPFRAYDRPIFAIPGNHDGMIFGTSARRPPGPRPMQARSCGRR